MTFREAAGVVEQENGEGPMEGESVPDPGFWGFTVAAFALFCVVGLIERACS